MTFARFWCGSLVQWHIKTATTLCTLSIWCTFLESSDYCFFTTLNVKNMKSFGKVTKISFVSCCLVICQFFVIAPLRFFICCKQWTLLLPIVLQLKIARLTLKVLLYFATKRSGQIVWQVKLGNRCFISATQFLHLPYTLNLRKLLLESNLNLSALSPCSIPFLLWM